MIRSEIQVDTVRMRTDIQELNQLLTRLRQEKSGMVQEVDELSATWSGPAHTTFRQQFALDTEALDTLCGNVTALIQGMEQARQEYDSCDRKVDDLVNGIRV